MLSSKLSIFSSFSNFIVLAFKKEFFKSIFLLLIIIEITFKTIEIILKTIFDFELNKESNLFKKAM